MRFNQNMRASSDVLLERMMRLHPKIIDLTLDRVWRLLETLDHPEKKLPPVIHIAGTNGKGSTLAMIRAGLEAAGARVHAYSSPHLARFNERIYLAGALIEEDFLSDILEHCARANNHAEITYFEITTVAALLAFSQVPADYCLLEVGLGGRLDATNVIASPALSIITPISIDHQAYLGTSLDKIAFEKAGIIKAKSSCIVGRQSPKAYAVIEKKAHEMAASLYRYGHEWSLEIYKDGMMYHDQNGKIALPEPVLLGMHQKENAGIAVAALSLLGERDMSARALREAKWPARMQRLPNSAFSEVAQGYEIWLDGGHNSAAGQALQICLKNMPAKALVVIVGMINTKDNRAFLQPFIKEARAVLTVQIPNEAASLSAGDLADIARPLNNDVREMPDIMTALKNAKQIAPEGRILITGSLYLAGHVIRLFA